jgi:hypothetical protein
MLSRAIRLVAALIAAFCIPHAAIAQSAIAGIVKDSTGAVLPGVTVEASSPALIEKTKSVITNDQGQYRLVDLRPGTYKVTFTLSGFATVVRDGILLESSFTAPLNVDMSVGAVEQNVTVTGESPVVDVQTSQRRELVSQQLIDLLPTGRSAGLIAGTLPGVVTGAYDVGGSTNGSSASPTVHGSLSGDARWLIDGMIADGMALTGQCQCLADSENQTQEIVVQMSGGSAENQLSGVLVNRIPRTGSNIFTSEEKVLFSNGSLQGRNLDDALRTRGLTTANTLDREYDLNYSLGGPIVRDRLWFYASGRNWSYNNFVAGAFYPDGTRAVADFSQRAFPIRLTAQVSSKNRVTALGNYVYRLNGHQNLSPQVPPIADLAQTIGPAWIGQVKWTSTLTNHLLLEAGFNRTATIGDNAYEPGVVVGTCHVAYNLCPPGTSYGDIAHQDTVLGTQSVASVAGTGAFSGPNTNRHRSNVAQASLSYVSGAHAIKAGFQDRWGWTTATRLSGTNGDLDQVYRSGVPFAVTILNTPDFSENDVDVDLGVFVQDVWTRKRLTLSSGIRWDHFNSSIPSQSVPAGRFVPARQFPPISNLGKWNNVFPRVGVAYDVTGRGRTAVKGNVGWYVQSEGPGFGSPYNPAIVSTDSRTWTDLNHDDIAEENEIGPPSNLNFGIRPNENMDPNISRPYQLVWDIGLQHQLLPGLGVEVSYNQRNFHDLIWINNLAISMSDYTLLNVPDPRGNGQTLPVYSISPAKFGQLNAIDSNSNQNSQVYRGVDVSFTMRTPGGGQVYGGTSTGHTVSNICQVTDPNSLRFCDQTQYPVPWLTLFKIAGTYPLPYGFRLSGIFQSTPNAPLTQIYVVTRAQAPGLTQASVNVPLNQPGSLYNDRVNQLDFTLARIFKSPFGARTIQWRPEVALYNSLNANPVLSQIATFGPSLGNASSILNPRVLRLGLTVQF